MFRQAFILSFTLALYSLDTLAGGPLVVEGPAGQTPVTYANPVIVLNIDPGTLGTKSNTQADALVQRAFSLWNNVSTSTILFIQGADLKTDININNFTTVLPNLNKTVLHQDDGLNPVVYDNNGSIIDAFFGPGQSNSTVGFATSIVQIGSSHFSEGYAVISGKDIGLSPLDFELIITHELGHMIGLDHTQANINNNEKYLDFPGVCTTSQPASYPVMYPFICRTTESLHGDDISAVSALYPTTDFSQNFGEVNGFLTDTAGNAILGANIWLENITTGVAYSTVSDYLKQRNGFYQLFVPPGNYTLHANSINSQFYEGSAIGPYAETANDLSFQSPHPIGNIVYQKTSGIDTVITVTNNQPTTINFNTTGQTGSIPITPSSSDSTGNLSLLNSLVVVLLLRTRRKLHTGFNRR